MSIVMSTSENLFKNSSNVYIDCTALPVHFYLNNQEEERSISNMLIIVVQQIKQFLLRELRTESFLTLESLSFSLDC